MMLVLLDITKIFFPWRIVDNLKITKLWNTIIIVANSIQIGQSFTALEWTVKNIVARSLTIFTAVVKWIKSALEILIICICHVMIKEWRRD